MIFVLVNFTNSNGIIDQNIARHIMSVILLLWCVFIKSLNNNGLKSFYQLAQHL